MKLNFAVVYERAPNNYSAYAPDLPGCVSVGDTWEEAQEMMREAIASHIEAMVEHGEPVPEPRTSLEGAAAYHEKALGEYDEETLARFTGADSGVPTTFGMIEVEVAASLAARTG